MHVHLFCITYMCCIRQRQKKSNGYVSAKDLNDSDDEVED